MFVSGMEVLVRCLYWHDLIPGAVLVSMKCVCGVSRELRGYACMILCSHICSPINVIACVILCGFRNSFGRVSALLCERRPWRPRRQSPTRRWARTTPISHGGRIALHIAMQSVSFVLDFVSCIVILQCLSVLLYLVCSPNTRSIRGSYIFSMY